MDGTVPAGAALLFDFSALIEVGSTALLDPIKRSIL